MSKHNPTAPVQTVPVPYLNTGEPSAAAEAYEEQLRIDHPDWDDDAIVNAAIAFEQAEHDAAQAVPVVPDPDTLGVEPPVVVQTESSTLAALETWDSAFANDPCAAEYLALATEAKELTDSVKLAPRYVSLGCRVQNIMVSEKNKAPDTYSRAGVLAKCKNAFRLCSVPESVRADSLLIAYWTVKLDNAEPLIEGTPRTFNSWVDDGYFTCGMTYQALRVLAPTIERVSGPKDIDSWEFKRGFDGFVGTLTERLRSGELSSYETEALIKFRTKRLADDAIAEQRSGMSAAQLAALDDKQIAREKEARLTKLRALTNAASEHAIAECGFGKEELAAFMAAQALIPDQTVNGIDIARIAHVLTPGDAKLLVQTVLALSVKSADRLPVFVAIKDVVLEHVRAVKAAKAEKPALAVA